MPLSTRPGLGWGMIGVLAFSFTVPFTRVADRGIAPLLIGSGRAVVGAGLAIVALAAMRARRPRGSEWHRLAITGGGIVVGFPLLTSYALTRVPASHGAVIVGLLPAATAVAVVARTGERPPATFWLAAAVGAASTIAFALTQSGGVGHLRVEDLMLLGAVASAAIGYAEGGLLARDLGAWQTVSWALVLFGPLMAGLSAASIAHRVPHATVGQWAAFGYLSVVSAYLGFFAWYRGLAIGPMAQVSQVQLTQPVLTICWSAAMLGERIGAGTAAAAIIVILSAGIAVRVRLAPPRDPGEPRRAGPAPALSRRSSPRNAP